MTTDINAAKKHISQVDPILRPIIKKAGAEIKYRKGGAFENLVRIISGQQLSGTVARAIFARVKQLDGGRSLTVASMDKITDAQLKSAGLSNAKIRTVRCIAAAFKDGSLNPRRLSRVSDEEAFRELVAVKGIGPWTANIYLMFVLQRPDVFPSTDLGIVTTMRKLYDVEGSQEELHEIAEKWRPYRSIACWYIWQAARSPEVA